MWLLSPPKLYFPLFAGVLFFALTVVAVPVQPELPLMSGGASSEDIENALSKTPSGTCSTSLDSPDLNIVDKPPGIEATLFINTGLCHKGAFNSFVQTMLDPIVPNIVDAIKSKYSTSLDFEEIQSSVPIKTVLKDKTIGGLDHFRIAVSFSAMDKKGKLSHFSNVLSYTGKINWNQCYIAGEKGSYGVNLKGLLTGELRQGDKVLVTMKKGEVSLSEPTAKKSISQRLKSTFGKKNQR
ncbi:hypothetical protein DFJ43DRAFT_1073115 [Lentinula guzmanii]|uniref:Uncharacterized protein n=1 Tax=Lentinula guzmanii TaxID=2804957 RepID=A0AA38N0A7_9AGAR|nr:hypothetical protein DFJ43DRAFT_1073115 [Lentinula guzmanii]